MKESRSEGGFTSGLDKGGWMEMEEYLEVDVALKGQILGGA